MKFSDTQLPSNKNFGYFFSIIFLIAGSYCLYLANQVLGYFLIFLAFIFFMTALLKPSLLITLNKLWMRLGLLLGKIISPIILGIIFFGLFTPYGIVMRLLGRDQLRIKKKKINTYWILRTKVSPQTNFKKQF